MALFYYIDSPFDPLTDIKELPVGNSIATYLVGRFPIGVGENFVLFRGFPSQNFMLPVDDWMETIIKEEDIFTLCRYPNAPAIPFIIQAVITVFISLIVASLLREKPKKSKQDNESGNNIVRGQQNEIRPNQRIPDNLGQFRLYPDLLAPTVSWFEKSADDNGKKRTQQIIAMYCCLGVGQYDLSKDINGFYIFKDGDTPTPVVYTSAVNVAFTGVSFTAPSTITIAGQGGGIVVSDYIIAGCVITMTSFTIPTNNPNSGKSWLVQDVVYNAGPNTYTITVVGWTITTYAQQLEVFDIRYDGSLTTYDGLINRITGQADFVTQSGVGIVTITKFNGVNPHAAAFDDETIFIENYRVGDLVVMFSDANAGGSNGITKPTGYYSNIYIISDIVYKTLPSTYHQVHLLSVNGTTPNFAVIASDDFYMARVSVGIEMQKWKTLGYYVLNFNALPSYYRSTDNLLQIEVYDPGDITQLGPNDEVRSNGCAERRNIIVVRDSDNVNNETLLSPKNINITSFSTGQLVNVSTSGMTYTVPIPGFGVSAAVGSIVKIPNDAKKSTDPKQASSNAGALGYVLTAAVTGGTPGSTDIAVTVKETPFKSESMLGAPFYYNDSADPLVDGQYNDVGPLLSPARSFLEFVSTTVANKTTVTLTLGLDDTDSDELALIDVLTSSYYIADKIGITVYNAAGTVPNHVDAHSNIYVISSLTYSVFGTIHTYVMTLLDQFGDSPVVTTANFNGRMFNFSGKAYQGPFLLPTPTDYQVWCDIVFEAGLYKVNNSSGKKSSNTIEVQFLIEEYDSNGNNIPGYSKTYTQTYQGNTATPLRFTQKIYVTDNLQAYRAIYDFPLTDRVLVKDTGDLGIVAGSVVQFSRSMTLDGVVAAGNAGRYAYVKGVAISGLDYMIISDDQFIVETTTTNQFMFVFMNTPSNVVFQYKQYIIAQRGFVWLQFVSQSLIRMSFTKGVAVDDQSIGYIDSFYDAGTQIVITVNNNASHQNSNSYRLLTKVRNETATTVDYDFTIGQTNSNAPPVGLLLATYDVELSMLPSSDVAKLTNYGVKISRLTPEGTSNTYNYQDDANIYRVSSVRRLIETFNDIEYQGSIYINEYPKDINHGNITLMRVIRVIPYNRNFDQQTAFNVVATRKVRDYSLWPFDNLSSYENARGAQTTTNKWINALMQRATDDYGVNLFVDLYNADPLSNQIDISGLQAIQTKLDLLDSGQGGQCNLSFTDIRTSDEELLAISAIARCAVFRIGDKLYFSRDEEKTNAVNLFNRRSKHPDGESVTFDYNFANPRDGVEVKFNDASKNYKQITFKYPCKNSPDDPNPTGPTPIIGQPLTMYNPESLVLEGITNWSQAYRAAIYFYRIVQLRRDAMEIRVTEDARLLAPNDKILNASSLIGEITRFIDGEVITTSTAGNTVTVVLSSDIQYSTNVSFRSENGDSVQTFLCTRISAFTFTFDQTLDVNGQPLAFTIVEQNSATDQVGTLFAAYTTPTIEDEPIEEWLVQTIDAEQDYVKLSCIRYVPEVYLADTTDIPSNTSTYSLVPLLKK